MNIKKRTLAKLPRGYSITVVPSTEVGGLPSFLAGSEGDDALLYFATPDFKPAVIAREPGGYISLVPMVHGGRRYVIAATKFKPGFNAAASDIRVYPLDRGEMPPCAIVADLPYTHRVALLERDGPDGKKYVLASTLCTAKADKDDWTQPGGILIGEVPADFSIEQHMQTPNARWPMHYVFPGMNKNHGLDFATLGAASSAGARDGYLVSAMEGLFFIEIPKVLDAGSRKTWSSEHICVSENSDAFAYDWDGDGEPEIFSISPFHGNELAMHKHTKQAGQSEWTRTLIHSDLAFGHIVWAGDFLGRPGLLAGSRRERRELRLYRPAADGSGRVDPNYTLIDEGIGPSQIAVVQRSPTRMALYVAAHGVDEVRIYEVTA